MKNSFVLYTEYSKHLELLSMEQRGVLFTAIMAFETGEEMPDMDGMTKMAFSFISEQLSRDKEKYESICKKRSEAGRNGGRPKANADAEKQEDICGEEESQTLSDESKKSKCFSQKASESKGNQGKAKKPDNEDEDEYEDDYEHEDEDKREDKKKGECEGEEGTPSSLDLAPVVCFIPGLSEFLQSFPNVVVDNRASPSLDLDFQALSDAFLQSSWLRKRPHDLSWVARNEQKIIGGTYKDHESADVYGDIRQELLREEALNDA